MSIKSVTFAVTALALVACGASPESLETETDELEDSTDVTSSALSPRDDLPMPVQPRFPSLDRPIWDLAPYLEDLHQYRRLDDGRCRRRYVTIFDPGRGRNIEIPITECF